MITDIISQELTYLIVKRLILASWKEAIESVTSDVNDLFILPQFLNIHKLWDDFKALEVHFTLSLIKERREKSICQKYHEK